MICKKCGRELPDDAKFCGVCGCPVSTLNDYTAAKEERPAAPAEPAPAAAPQPRYQQAPPTGTAPGYRQEPSAAYAPGFLPDKKDPLTTGQFLGMDLLMLVPVLNIVLLILWGFGENANQNRKNWARSRLVWLTILLVITIFVLVIALITV